MTTEAARAEMTDAEYAQTRLRMLRALTDTAFHLANAVGQQALRDWGAPEAMPARTGAVETKTAGKSADAATLFTRLTAAVRQLVALEARLIAGPKPARAPKAAKEAPPPAAEPPAPDPRREPIHTVLEYLTSKCPNKKQLLKDGMAVAEEHMAAKPDARTDELILPICDQANIGIDYAKVPDDILHIMCGPPEFGPPYVPGEALEAYLKHMRETQANPGAAAPRTVYSWP